jgi:hypothetical protein
MNGLHRPVEKLGPSTYVAPTPTVKARSWLAIHGAAVAIGTLIGSGISIGVAALIGTI